MRRRGFRIVVALLFVFATAAALAQIPDAPNCAMDQPPPEAGAYATPGGFLLVHRNAGLTDGYTGCKMVWVVDAPDRFHRLMILCFERGKLRVAQGYDARGENQLRATCTVPGTGPGCDGVESHPLSALRLPTWPRSCMTRPDAPQCAKNPD